MHFKPLTIGVSSTALFDLREEDAIFRSQGIKAYRQFQSSNRLNVMKPGTAFSLVQKLLALNVPQQPPRVEVAMISKNDIETGLRVRHSLDHYKLEVPRIALTGGKPVEPRLLKAYGIDLFLSRSLEDVQKAVDDNLAACVLHDPPQKKAENKGKIHFAFDGDQVLFSGESEHIFQKEGLLRFLQYEQDLAETPLPEGPFAKLLFIIEALKATYPANDCPVETSLVTMRSGGAQVRPMNTLISWGKILDGAYMIGRANTDGMKYQKVDVLEAIGADIFFDDQICHTEPASLVVPSGHVPPKTAQK